MAKKSENLFGALTDFFLGEEVLDVSPETPAILPEAIKPKPAKKRDPNAGESVATVIKPSTVKPGSGGDADSAADTEETG